MRVAFLGLGRMGAPMAEHVRRAGHDLTVWNRDLERARPLAVAGAAQAVTAREAVADRDVIVLMLFGPDAVHEVLFGPEGVVAGARPGTLVVDASTIGPDAARGVAAVLRDHKLRYIEAPVIGSVAPARAGTLGVLAGGDPDDYAVAEPLLRLWGDPERIRYTGPVGTANALKIVLNLTLGVAMAGIAEAMRLGADLDLDPDLVLDALAAGPLGSTVTIKRPMLASGEFEPPTFSLDLIAKDLELARNAGRRPLPVTEAVSRAVAASVAAGYGGQDFASLAADTEARSVAG